MSRGSVTVYHSCPGEIKLLAVMSGDNILKNSCLDPGSKSLNCAWRIADICIVNYIMKLKRLHRYRGCRNISSVMEV